MHTTTPPTPLHATVVVVEDDRSVREMLAAVLSNVGYEVHTSPDAETVLARPLPSDRAIVVLDVGLPGIDGIDLCSHLRRRGHRGGVLMLTARHEVADRVAGLDAGADDYLVKPFALDELLARVRALARREASGQEPPGGTTFSLGGITIDESTRSVFVDGAEVSFTRTEFDLLDLLLRNSPHVLDRSLIQDRIWGYPEELGSNTLEVFVSQVRRKLGPHGRHVQTVRGVGYTARPDPS